MAPNRQMCNELVYELCKEIPTAKTSDRILLTAHNMYAYLAPGFSKKLIYRDAISVLKLKLNAKKNFLILIDRVAQNIECEPILVINQKQSDNEFNLETSHFRVHIWNADYRRQCQCAIFVPARQFENVQLDYFLRLIAPLFQPIHLEVSGYNCPIARLAHFMNAQSDWIDSIKLRDNYLKSEPIYETLSKYNRLEICDPISPINVPKLIQWLTSNNDIGQPKKYLLLRWNFNALDDGLVLFIGEIKKEFARATSKSRFVVRLRMLQPLDEFTLCNELTGEKLQLCRKNIENERYYFTHALNRIPNNGLEENENDCAELGTFTTTISFC